MVMKMAKTTASAAILCLAVCGIDFMNKVAICGTRVYYVIIQQCSAVL